MSLSLRLASFLLLAATPVLAGDKSSGPAVPGFTRFHAANPDAEGGSLLSKTLHCGRCHSKPNTPDAAHTPGPILDEVGTRVKRSYLRAFLTEPHKVKPGTTMPDLLAGFDAQERKDKVESLVHFLASTGTPRQILADREGVILGRDLYHKVGCVACHGTRDAVGDQEKLYANSVPLGNLKAKYTLDSLGSFLENPHGPRPHGRMPGLLKPKEATDAANYLMQGTAQYASSIKVAYSYYEGAWKNLPEFAKLKPAATGTTAAFQLNVAKRQNNCALKFDGFLKIDAPGEYAFHVNSDDGAKLWIDGKLIVDNDGIHAPQSKSSKVKLAKGVFPLTLAVFNAGGGFELKATVDGPGIDKQPLGSLVRLEEKEKPIVRLNDDDTAPLQPELIKQGKELFATIGCANCHALGKEDRRLSAPAMAKLKPDGGCLDAAPKKGVPRYGLNAAQASALAAMLKKPAPAKAETKVQVAFTMKLMNCYACHERDKLGGVEDDVNKHFQTVMPEMGEEGRMPPSLTGVGAKMKLAYMKKVIEQGSHDRPYMHTRMPKFGKALTELADQFAQLDPKEPGFNIAAMEGTTKIKAAARTMVGPQAFGCVKCHTFAGSKAEGVQGIDMTLLAERLNKDWFHNFMVNPSKYREGTRMPSSFPEGKTQLKNVLDGTAPTQIEAIWIYLADGKAATPPFGINKTSIQLVPALEAIIYRNFLESKGPGGTKLQRGIAVGFPENAHLAFDANDMRLAMIWHGTFLDAKVHWLDRGSGYAQPLGDNVINFPAGASFFVLAQPEEAWPTKSAKELGYQFGGYRLTDDQRPTFLYSFNEIKIEDTPNAVEVKGSPIIRRTLTLTMENPIDKVYFRAAVADKIDAEKDGSFRVGELRLRIESDTTPIVRTSGKKMELLVPLRWKGNAAKVVVEYQW